MVEGFHVEGGEDIFFVVLEGKSGPTDRNDRTLSGSTAGRTFG